MLLISCDRYIVCDRYKMNYGTFIFMIEEHRKRTYAVHFINFIVEPFESAELALRVPDHQIKMSLFQTDMHAIFVPVRKTLQRAYSWHSYLSVTENRETTFFFLWLWIKIYHKGATSTKQDGFLLISIIIDVLRIFNLQIKPEKKCREEK